MRRSRTALLVAVAAAGQLACGRSWPAVRATSDQGFAGGTVPVARIDVMPIDVALDAREELEMPRDELEAVFDGAAQGALSTGLGRSGYQVGAMMDWDGNFTGYDGRTYNAMPGEALVATADSLATYGVAQATQRGMLLVPYLPARLGSLTGSDATLYVGGWAWSGDNESTGAKVAKGLLIAVAVIAIVALVVVVARSKGGGGAIGRAAGGAAEVAGRTVGHAARFAGRGLLRASRGIARAGLHTIDAFGRMHTHLNIYIEASPSRQRAAMPHGGPSRMMLEMTLVDNRTGRVLWHARQQFHADPANEADVNEAFLRMIRTMPAR